MWLSSIGDKAPEVLSTLMTILAKGIIKPHSGACPMFQPCFCQICMQLYMFLGESVGDTSFTSDVGGCSARKHAVLSVVSCIAGFDCHVLPFLSTEVTRGTEVTRNPYLS